MSEANLLKFPVVFATVFTQEIFSNFCRNALKSPNISWVGGNSLWLDADIFTSLIISLQILGAPCSLSGHPFRVRGVRPGSPQSGPGLQSNKSTFFGFDSLNDGNWSPRRKNILCISG